SATELAVTVTTPQGVGMVSFTVVSPVPSVAASSPAYATVGPAIRNSSYVVNTFDVNSYGASGSALSYSCTGKAGSKVLVCDEPSNDFRPGQGIRIVGAG